jgi:hypothetical protein
MMREIWKFPLEITDRQNISMPCVFRLLTVQVQNGQPVAWAVVEPKSARVEVRFFCVGTGNPEMILSDIQAYLGTVQLDGLVWHYFWDPLFAVEEA